MSTFLRPFGPAVQGPVGAAFARGALAAALLAAWVACVAWPSPAAAQQRDDAASSASADSPGASNQKSDEDDLPAATRRARADERRLFGGPRSTLDPYQSSDPSPKAQEDALMDEQRMTIISPSEFYSLNKAGMGGTDGGGASAAKQRPGTMPAAGTQANGPDGSPKRYVYGAGASSPVYRDPYEAQRTAAGQPYRSPW